MKDADVFHHINELVAEEHHLEDRAGVGEPLSPEDERRLRDIEVSLDQCWDLLRQRRARRAAGLDPDDAAPRDPSVVEHYRQ
jgi:hypothetical protein